MHLGQWTHNLGMLGEEGRVLEAWFHEMAHQFIDETCSRPGLGAIYLMFLGMGVKELSSLFALEVEGALFTQMPFEGGDHWHSWPWRCEIDLNHLLLLLLLLCFVIGVSEGLILFFMDQHLVGTLELFHDATYEFLRDSHQVVVVSVSPIEFT